MADPWRPFPSSQHSQSQEDNRYHTGYDSQFYDLLGINHSHYFLPSEFQGLSITKSNATEIIKNDDNHGGESSEQREESEEESSESKNKSSSESKSKSSSESKGKSKEMDILSKLPFTKYTSSGSSKKWWGKSSKDNKCGLCKTKYRENEIVTTLPCGHKFHQSCLIPWFQDNKNCSICNEEVVPS